MIYFIIYFNIVYKIICNRIVYTYIEIKLCVDLNTDFSVIIFSNHINL